MEFQLDLTFFGLTPEVAPQFRLALFKQIHEIVFHGKGGYDWHTVYNMPIWLRRYTFNEIKKFYEDQNEAVNKSSSPKNQKIAVDSSGKVNTPEFVKASESYKSKGQIKYK